MEEEMKYEIGGKNFIQKRLVWGQAKQLIKEIEGVELPSNFTPKDVLKVLESRIPALIAIVLIPEGETARKKDNAAMIEFFEWEMSLEQTIQVIEDFFVCNPIPLWLEKVGSGMEKMMGDSKKSLEKATGSTETLQSLQEVTSQEETT